MSPEVLALAEALAAILTPKPANNAPRFYSSTTALPPNIPNNRIFAERCRSIPEAYREGRGWCCPVEAWHAARSARPAPPADDPETLLASAGVRLRRGAR